MRRKIGHTRGIGEMTRNMNLDYTETRKGVYTKENGPK